MKKGWVQRDCSFGARGVGTSLFEGEKGSKEENTRNASKVGESPSSCRASFLVVVGSLSSGVDESESNKD